MLYLKKNERPRTPFEPKRVKWTFLHQPCPAEDDIRDLLDIHIPLDIPAVQWSILSIRGKGLCRIFSHRNSPATSLSAKPTIMGGCYLPWYPVHARPHPLIQ